MSSLQKLLWQQIQKLYAAERQLVQTLPKFVDASNSADLKELFIGHLDQTQEQVVRLRQILEIQGSESGEKNCEAMSAIIAEGEEVIALSDVGAVRDAGLIAASRRVEHYEIAGYKAVISIAGQLGEEDIVDLLQQSLDEELIADESLATAAQNINEDAQNASSSPE